MVTPEVHGLFAEALGLSKATAAAPVSFVGQ